MAIKFVDIEPEDGKPKKARTPQAAVEATKSSVGPEPADGELPLSGLPPNKPAPKDAGGR